jgi:hypothetical protein
LLRPGVIPRAAQAFRVIRPPHFFAKTANYSINY